MDPLNLDAIKERTAYFPATGRVSREEVAAMIDVIEALHKQIDRLAQFILTEVPGEPSQSEGAVNCAIRIMQHQRTQIEALWAALEGGPGVNHLRLGQIPPSSACSNGAT